jgi:hypothetical protein
MPIVPEYEAEVGLNTAKSSMPDTTFPAYEAAGLRHIGENLSELGAHMLAREKQNQDTDATYKWQDFQQSAQENTTKVVNENEAPDGQGMTSDANNFIITEGEKVVSSMPARLQKEYRHKLEILRRDHQLQTSGHEANKRYNYHSGKADELAGSKTVEAAVNPDKADDLIKQHEADVDKMPITPAQKDILKKHGKEVITKGRAEGERKRDPKKFKEDQGVVTGEGESMSGGKLPKGKMDGGFQSRQIAFVWHELNPKMENKGHGGGSEKNAYYRLKRATTLEAAVNAGLSYERPHKDKANFAGRLAHARNVLSGNATPSAMKAYRYFLSKGLTPVQAAGMTGTLMGESGSNLNPGAYNPNDPGGSVGVGQWNRERKANMYAFANAGTDSGPSSDTGATWTDPNKPPPAGFGQGNYDEDNVTETYAEPSPKYAHMSPEWRLSQINQADAEIKERQNAAYQEAAHRSVSLSNDSLTTYAEQGNIDGVAEPTLNDFIGKNKGDAEAGGDEYRQYLFAKKTAILSHDFQKMTIPEINAAIEQFRSTMPMGEDAAESAELAAKLETIANKEIAKKEMWQKQFSYMKQFVPRIKDWGQRTLLELQKANAVQLAAMATARKKRIDDLRDNPFETIFNSDPVIRNLWVESQSGKGPTDAGLSVNPVTEHQAIDAMYREQKRQNVQPENMQLLPPDQVDNIVKNILDDTGEVSPQNKIALLESVFYKTQDNKYRRLMFNQLNKAGLPKEMQYPLEALIRGEEGAYRQLFMPALSTKEAKPMDSTKIGDIKDKAYEIVSSAEGRALFGSGIVDSESLADTQAAHDLMVNYAIMTGGDKKQVQKAFDLIKGRQQLLSQEYSYGTTVEVMLPATADVREFRTGFQNLNADVTQEIIKREDPNDPTTPDKAQQIVNQGQWRNDGDGFSFRLPDGTLLRDQASGEPMVWTRDQVEAAAARGAPKDQERLPESTWQDWLNPGGARQRLKQMQGPEPDVPIGVP